MKTNCLLTEIAQSDFDISSATRTLESRKVAEEVLRLDIIDKTIATLESWKVDEEEQWHRNIHRADQ